MLIASKNRNQIINMNEAMVAFVNAESRIVVASAGGKNMVLDEYDTRTDALTAMRILTERLRLANSEIQIVFAPTDEEVKAYRVSSGENKSGVHHYADGGKTKRRGGS